MHKLTRPAAPTCLNQFHHGQNNWDDVDYQHKNEIWLRLDQMQQNRCAYCETHINTEPDNRAAHIEHFRQRNRYPQGTFLWSNLFGSCNRQDSCGTHKDNLPPYEYQDLIKMDVEDPEKFLRFLPDGNVVTVEGLSPNEKRRAEETIRIFNLNGPLRHIRKVAVMGYLQIVEEIAVFAEECDEEDWLPLLLKEELDKVQNLPFATAIKHTLSL